jgi:hypothetical protein
MEPHRRPKLVGLPARSSQLHAPLRVRRARIRRNQINPRFRHRPHDLRLRSRNIRAEAQALVALAVGRGVQRRRGVVVVAAIARVHLRRDFGRLAFQTMARPMAAPARNGLRQHENRHQLGNECLHNDRIFFPIITVIGSPVNVACDNLGPPAAPKASPTPIFRQFLSRTRSRKSPNRTGQNDCRQSF